MERSRLYPDNAKKSGLLKILLGIFVATEGIPYSANEFVDEARTSSKITFIWTVVAIFWFSLVAIIIISILFFKNSNTLFNVSVKTELIEISPFPGIHYPKWAFDNVRLYDGCDEESENISGELTISNNATIEFRRIKKSDLEITLDAGDFDSAGILSAGDRTIELSDCVGLVMTVTEATSLTLPIDGKISVGGDVKEGLSRMPILIEGIVRIADKAVLSSEYYIAEKYILSMGTKFNIRSQSTQSSGFVFIDSTPAMKATYTGKGSVGLIERYKIEPISISNSFWTKLYNDETIIVLWLLLGALYTFVKVSIRYCIE